MSNDNEHGKQEFTQAQAQAMVAFIERLATAESEAISSTVRSYAIAILNQVTPAPATPTASGDAADGKRYGITFVMGRGWYVFDYDTNEIIALDDKPYPTQEKAQHAAAIANAMPKESGKP